LRRLVGRVEEAFGRRRRRETIRRALHRLELSWKKARKLLGRADPQRREAFLAQVQDLLAGARHDRHRLVYLDEAHIHQDAGLGHGWSARGQRFWVGSHSPRLADKLSFYGLYLYNQGEARLWPYARANGENTIDVLHRLRAEWPNQPLILLWDGAPYHRAKAVREAAAALRIELVPLPSYSPDFMPVEALWHWLREDVTYHHCHRTAEDLSRRVAASEARLNQAPCVVADRLSVKERLNPEEEKLRFPR
jgi:transposase